MMWLKSDTEGDFERREKVVENIGVARRQRVEKVGQFIWFVFTVVEVLIALRFFLKLIAANPANLFAQLIYTLSGPFMIPFVGLTATPGIGRLVLEIPALIAMIVYLFIAWALVSLIQILFNRSSARNVTVYERRRE